MKIILLIFIMIPAGCFWDIDEYARAGASFASNSYYGEGSGVKVAYGAGTDSMFAPILNCEYTSFQDA